MKQFFFCLFLLSLFSCNSDDDNSLDCTTVLCVGRPALTLEFLDMSSQEYYFTDVTDTAPEGLIVTLDNTGTELNFGQGYFINDGQLQIFQFPDQVTIALENEFETTISAVVTQIDDGGCCPGYMIDNVTASNGILEQVFGNDFLYRLTL